MAASLQDWFTNILGVQSVAEFGAQQPQYQHDPAVLAEVDCSSYLLSNPEGFERTSLAFFKDNLAVVPEWSGGSISTFQSNCDTLYRLTLTSRVILAECRIGGRWTCGMHAENEDCEFHCL